ncbi:MAG: single-stranded DNA-binding protein [Elusimicrobia bacterium]|nr:single-stranded DNA-binding protein [Elusimicrobiota bacterium]
MDDGNEQDRAPQAPGRPGKPAIPQENEACVVGRMVNPPKFREGKSEKGSPWKMARFMVAVNRTYKGREETDFIPVVVWEGLAEAVRNAGKGTALRVSGRIKTYEVEGKQYRWELSGEVLQVLDLRPLAQPAPGDGKTQAAGEGVAEQQEELVPY